eukprot:CAMPEP_0195288912 /NCGR_PEP_ID=MMETSP0707-20130614/5389_1 /TAXON_ID=33640 /ORGANISM="Asterionellopsis glacialis, Strain CCMP134" /LENGTH=578 /DNA_ID=CAMNT_0040348841 /DNA_START=12 /DNA_END=1745 /DNA_ORIENTATION=+
MLSGKSGSPSTPPRNDNQGVSSSITGFFSNMMKTLQEEEMNPSESILQQSATFSGELGLISKKKDAGSVGSDSGLAKSFLEDLDSRLSLKTGSGGEFDDDADDCSSMDSSSSAHKKPHLPEWSNVRCPYESIEDAMKNKSQQHKLIVWIQGEIPIEDYQTAAFTHPLLAEAVEDIPEFLRLKTLSPMPSSEQETKLQQQQQQRQRHNNTRDKRQQQQHQTVQILDVEGRDILVDNEKMSPQWTRAGVATLFIRALEYCGTKPSGIPKYLSIVQEEESGRFRVGRGGTFYRVEKHALFSTKFVFTSGEAEFAAIEGVICTKAGYIKDTCNKHKRIEAVRVTFDSSKLAYNKLVRSALKRKVADICFYRNQEEFNAAHVEIHSFLNHNQNDNKRGEMSSSASTASSESFGSEINCDAGNLRPFDSSTMVFEVSKRKSKMPLRDSVLARVPLTELQAARTNRLINRGEVEKAYELLSPQQRMIMARREYSTRESMRNLKCNTRDYIGLPIEQAWERVFKQLNKLNHWRHPHSDNNDEKDATAPLRRSGIPEHQWGRQPLKMNSQEKEKRLPNLREEIGGTE